MNQETFLNRNEYYEKINHLFAYTTAAVILLCLLSLPFFPLNDNDTQWFLYILGASALFTVIKYIFLKKYMSYDNGYYITDILNPLMTGLLIDVSGKYGLYLYFLFFLQLMGSIALLRFRHVIVSIVMISSISIYLFFISDSFGLGEPERYAAGLILLVVLFLMTVFTHMIMQELLHIMNNIKTQKSSFIQDVSHELRTPLTVIKGIADILKDGRMATSNIPTQYGSYINLINHLNSASEDLENITEKLSVESRVKISADSQDQLTTVTTESPNLKKSRKRVA